MSCFRVSLPATAEKHCQFTGRLCRFSEADNVVVDTSNGRSHLQISQGARQLASIIVETVLSREAAPSAAADMIEQCGGAQAFTLGSVARRDTCPVDNAATWHLFPNRQPNQLLPTVALARA
jgi:hypothetical protein